MSGTPARNHRLTAKPRPSIITASTEPIACSTRVRAREWARTYSGQKSVKPRLRMERLDSPTFIHGTSIAAPRDMPNDFEQLLKDVFGDSLDRLTQFSSEQ